jgi:hypothetical protein
MTMGSIEQMVSPPPKGKLRKGITAQIAASDVATAIIIADTTSFFVFSFFIRTVLSAAFLRPLKYKIKAPRGCGVLFS